MHGLLYLICQDDTHEPCNYSLGNKDLPTLFKVEDIMEDDNMEGMMYLRISFHIGMDFLIIELKILEEINFCC